MGNIIQSLRKKVLLARRRGTLTAAAVILTGLVFSALPVRLVHAQANLPPEATSCAAMAAWLDAAEARIGPDIFDAALPYKDRATQAASALVPPLFRTHFKVDYGTLNDRQRKEMYRAFKRCGDDRVVLFREPLAYSSVPNLFETWDSALQGLASEAEANAPPDSGPSTLYSPYLLAKGYFAGRKLTETDQFAVFTFSTRAAADGPVCTRGRARVSVVLKDHDLRIEDGFVDRLVNDHLVPLARQSCRDLDQVTANLFFDGVYFSGRGTLLSQEEVVQASSSPVRRVAEISHSVTSSPQRAPLLEYFKPHAPSERNDYITLAGLLDLSAREFKSREAFAPIAAERRAAKENGAALAERLEAGMRHYLVRDYLPTEGLSEARDSCSPIEGVDRGPDEITIRFGEGSRRKGTIDPATGEITYRSAPFKITNATNLPDDMLRHVQRCESTFNYSDITQVRLRLNGENAGQFTAKQRGFACVLYGLGPFSCNLGCAEASTETTVAYSIVPESRLSDLPDQGAACRKQG